MTIMLMVADPVNIFRILPPFSAKSERQVFVTAQKLIKREDFDFGVLNMKSAFFFKRNDLQRFNISKCMCKLYQTAGFSVKSKFVCKLLLGTCGARGCLASLS